MDVSNLPKTVTRQCHGCDLNPGPTAPESSTLTTQLPSHPDAYNSLLIFSSTYHITVQVYNITRPTNIP